MTAIFHCSQQMMSIFFLSIQNHSQKAAFLINNTTNQNGLEHWLITDCTFRYFKLCTFPQFQSQPFIRRFGNMKVFRTRILKLLGYEAQSSTNFSHVVLPYFLHYSLCWTHYTVTTRLSREARRGEINLLHLKNKEKKSKGSLSMEQADADRTISGTVEAVL